MTVHQISLFLENKPGRLAAICRTLTESGVNIASLSLAAGDAIQASAEGTPIVVSGETAKYGNIILKKGVTPVA